MKKFEFPLSRAMSWRQTMAQMEESKLQNLYAELRAIEASEVALVAERERNHNSVVAAASVTGSELAALDAFRRFAVAEHTRLELRRADCVKRIASQVQVVTQKRRDVRLLEQLRSTRFVTWKREMEREIDLQAEEAYLARWSREA
jgi:hypothetical protein